MAADLRAVRVTDANLVVIDHNAPRGKRTSPDETRRLVLTRRYENLAVSRLSSANSSELDAIRPCTTIPGAGFEPATLLRAAHFKCADFASLSTRAPAAY